MACVLFSEKYSWVENYFGNFVALAGEVQEVMFFS